MAGYKTLKFADVTKAKRNNVKEERHTFEVTPEEMGLDPEIVEAGERLILVFRPITRDEYNEAIALAGKFTGAEFRDELDFDICRRGLIEPALPASAEGRKFLENIAPGTLSNISSAIQAKSGYRRDYAIDAKDARAAMDSLGSTTPVSTSSSK